MAGRFQRVWAVFALVLGGLLAAPAVADRDEDIAAFLTITGFDVALDSIALGAEGAPAILGQDPGEFGVVWQKMVREVMKPSEIRATAIDMLSQTLTPDLLDHAMEFYGSDLGQRLVAAENGSHMEKGEDGKDEAGEAIVAALVRAGPEGRDRLEYFRRMNLAIDPQGMTVRAMQEIQIRFLLAAAGAGVIQLKMDEPDLREMFKQQEPQIRASLLRGALANAAYTYQAFEDADVRAYTEALEDPKMQSVYELMNAVHYEIMAQRFEMLAAKMASLRPSQEL